MAKISNLPISIKKIIFSMDGNAGLALGDDNQIHLFSKSNNSWSYIGITNLPFTPSTFNEYYIQRSLSADFLYAGVYEPINNLKIYKRNNLNWSLVGTITHPNAFSNIPSNRNDPNNLWMCTETKWDKKTCYPANPGYDCSYKDCKQISWKTCSTNYDKTSSDYLKFTCAGTDQYACTYINKICGSHPFYCVGTDTCVGQPANSPFIANCPHADIVSSLFGVAFSISTNANVIAVYASNGLSPTDTKGRGIGSVSIFRKSSSSVDSWNLVQDIYYPGADNRRDWFNYLTNNGVNSSEIQTFNPAGNYIPPALYGCNPAGNYIPDLYADMELKYNPSINVPTFSPDGKFLAIVGGTIEGTAQPGYIWYNSNPSTSSWNEIQNDILISFPRFFDTNKIGDGARIYKFNNNENKFIVLFSNNFIYMDNFKYYINNGSLYKLNETARTYEIIQDIFSNKDINNMDLSPIGLCVDSNDNVEIFLQTNKDYNHGLSDSEYKSNTSLNVSNFWQPSTNKTLYIFKCPFSPLVGITTENQKEIYSDFIKIDNNSSYRQKFITYGNPKVDIKYYPSGLSYNTNLNLLSGKFTTTGTGVLDTNTSVGYYLTQITASGTGALDTDYVSRGFIKMLISPSNTQFSQINRVGGEQVDFKILLNNYRNTAVLGYNEGQNINQQNWSSDFKTLIASVKKNNQPISPPDKLPFFISFDQNTDKFDGIVSSKDYGEYQLGCQLSGQYFTNLSINKNFVFNFGPKITSPIYARGNVVTNYTDSNPLYKIIAEDIAGYTVDFYSGEFLPNGLYVNPVMGTIIGSTNKEGNYDISVKVRLKEGGSSSKKVNLQIGPKIVSNLTITGKLNENFIYNTLASGNPQSVGNQDPYSAVGIIDNLEFNSKNGVLGGSITRGIGQYKIILSTYNQFGFDEKELLIKIGPKIIDDLNLSARSNTIFNHKILVQGEFDSITAVGLPPGIKITNDGYITGTATSYGVYEGFITIKNSNINLTDVKSFKLRVGLKIISENKIKVKINENFNYQIASSPIAFRYDAKNLFGNLSINKSTGLISGTIAKSGVYKILLYAYDNTNLSEQELIIEVGPKINIDSNIISCELDRKFIYKIRGEGDPSLYSATNLPAGLSIDNRGYITGTPKDLGIFQSRLYISNNLGNDYKDVTFTVFSTIDDVLVSKEINGIINTLLEYQIYTIGNVDEYGAENLPIGLTLNSITGKITGQPKSDGIFISKIYAKSGNNISSRNITFFITSKVNIDLNQYAVLGDYFFYALNISGNYFSINVQNLPQGLTFNSSNNSIEGIINAPGEYDIKILIQNEAGTASYILKVFADTNEKIDYKLRYKVYSFHFGAYHDGQKYYLPENQLTALDMYNKYLILSSSSSISSSSSLTLAQRIELLEQNLSDLDKKIPSSSSSSSSSFSSEGPIDYVRF